MRFFCFKTPFYAAKTSTWPVTHQIGANRRVNRRASRGQALAVMPGDRLWRHDAGRGGGSDFKARWARPGAGGSAGACAMLAALCGASGGLGQAKEKPGGLGRARWGWC
jgi:hypothetical protein